MLLSYLVSNFAITPLYNLSHTRIIHNWLIPIKTKLDHKASNGCHLETWLTKRDEMSLINRKG